MYKFDREKFETELTDYYKTYTECDHRVPLFCDIEKRWKEGTGDMKYPEEKKAYLYELERELPVHIFRYSPFYFEAYFARPRINWGLCGVGAIMRYINLKPEIILDEIPDFEETVSRWNNFIDWDHHCVGYDNVLKYGLLGIRKRAEEKLALAEKGSRSEAFLNAVITAMDTLIDFGKKFSREAERMAEGEEDPCVRENLLRIAETAMRVPAEPPQTFYEALATIDFMREMLTSTEGVAISQYGMIDRMLYPYYERDIKEGRITREEAKDLIKAFLAYTDVRLDVKNITTETSTVLDLGGTERDGSPIYNEVTRLFCEAFMEENIIGVKFNEHITEKHDDRIYNDCADVLMAGLNSLIVINQDSMFKAHTAMGKDPYDCRYISTGGCYEPMLQNCEVNFKAFVYLNMPKVFENYFKDCKAETYEEFYDGFMDRLNNTYDILSGEIYKNGKLCGEMNPCPMLSATVDDCIEKGKDMFDGGARYNSASIANNGLGTIINSLYAVKTLCYDKKIYSLENLKEAVANNFEGREDLRAECLRVPKYGSGDENVLREAKKIAEDIIARCQGRPVGRGEGVTEPSFFTYSHFHSWGNVTGATPDGRLKGDYISRVIGPYEEDLTSVTDAINDSTVLPMDLACGSAVLEMNIENTKSKEALMALMKTFIQKKGNMFQPSFVSYEELKDAEIHPEKHKTLSVRLYGFSAFFVTLPPHIREEFLRRTMTK
ncbi:MAG: hypothetical protein KBT47_06360 [Armatimonadetes bacterium]|nr:hypothetical protein [Candidatus Hippobium faecium]